jgi:hypothetical protein
LYSRIAVKHKHAVWFLLGITILTSGCSSNGGPVSVRGKVLLDDIPVEGATVTLMPIEQGRPAAGLTDPNGVFRLTTFERDDGALPGTYKIVVTKTNPISPPPEGQYGEVQRVRTQDKGKKTPRTKEKPPLPAIYADVVKSPLRATVPTDGEVVLRLDSKAK